MINRIISEITYIRYRLVSGIWILVKILIWLRPKKRTCREVI